MKFYISLFGLLFCSVCHAQTVYCEEALRLPFYSICQDQKSRAQALVNHYENEQRRFPSRAHLLTLDLEDAKDRLTWWATAMNCCYYVQPSNESVLLEMDVENYVHLYQSGRMDEIEYGLTRMKEIIGEENWWLGNWPWVDEVPRIERWYYRDNGYYHKFKKDSERTSIEALRKLFN